MAESHGYIKFLPEGTGKRIPHSVMMELDYGNGTIPFKSGDVIVGTTSGIVGTVLEVRGTTTSGELHITLLDPIYNDASNKIPNNPQFTLLEPLQVDGITRANAASTGYAFYIQQSTLVGHKNNTHGIDIDRFGAMYTRFAEGSPQFDAFGKLQVSQQHIVAEYTHQYGIDIDKVSSNIIGAASISHLPLSAGVLLQTSTAALDKAELVSHQYHPYRLGESRLVEFTCASGDAGKTNVDRIWGYGDDEDGVFFKLQGTVMGCQIKSSVSGTVVKTFVPMTEWSKDRLDGTLSAFNPSGMTLDVTKETIYWIDLQYLGIGTVRFGVIMDGVRIICHEWHHTNTTAYPYMRTATLPIYYEIVNRDVSASSSEMRLWCTTVKTEGMHETPTKDYSHVAIPHVINSTTATPLFSFRAKQTVNGFTNRKTAYPKNISLFSDAGTLIVELWKNPVITGDTWLEASDATNSVEFDEGATSISGGRRVTSIIVNTNSGTNELNLNEIFNSLDDGVRRHFNPANYDLYTLTARRISGTANTNVVATINWEEA